ncbi:MAG TPA: PAS domain-containing sensor histidine kinase [Longimicrobiales bacterium]|nr:PAS domain-containing sensor histidine kinase [Longimicrobiales bacterium]
MTDHPQGGAARQGREEDARFRSALGAGGAPHETVDIHRLLVASVQDYAIFVLDTTGHILTWNAGAERLKGYTAEEIIGRHFSTFYTPDALDRAHPQHELRVAEAEGRYEEEGWRIRKDGTRFWANVVITALRNDAGELVGFAKVTRDLTDRRAAQLQAIEDARRLAEAEAANRAKSEFLATMSHELRTPLNAIGGYVDLLAYGVHGALNEAQLTALERVRAGQHHLLMLINDLLNFSKVEAGRLSYIIAPVRLADVAGAVEPLIAPQAAGRRIAIEWQDADATVVAAADAARAEQILLNLLTNAVKYTEPGGSVSVRHFLRGDRAALEVGDTGGGIPADQTEAIFEPFTQLGRTLTSSHEGAGLGLAISRELARGMRGDLTVSSTVGVGSVFTLSLPRS